MGHSSTASLAIHRFARDSSRIAVSIRKKLLRGLSAKHENSRADPFAARQRAPLCAALTRQERGVLQLIAEGHSNREIGAILNRSIHTIHAHRGSLMAKLNIHKQAALICYAIKSGIAEL